jgi:microsomal dipeptidase-like Zn-dependent dipeptidase
MPAQFPPIFDGHNDALLRMRMDGISFLDRNDGPDSGCVFDLPRCLEGGILGGMPKLVAALAERGYHGEDLEKIMYRNWIRVLRDTWGE